MKILSLVCTLIFSLVLSWSMVIAEDGFYVIATKKANYAPVEKTGQTTCYDENGQLVTDCLGTGQDGEYQEGIPWPAPRFSENGDGTVTDNLTGLIWLHNGNCTVFFSGDTTGINDRSWNNALIAANFLANGYCGLSDGSSAGDWRLPNVRELQSLIDYGRYNFSLPTGFPFTNVKALYWTSTTYAPTTYFAWYVSIYDGSVQIYNKAMNNPVWPVRGGN